jgi:N-dimethylarginine dimethylaminohydrolase
VTPAPRPLSIFSEFGRLEVVVMATPRHFHVIPPVNETQRRFFATDPPDAAELVREQEAFVAALRQHGVEVVWAAELEDCPLQLNTRDIAAVVGEACLLGHMRYDVRARELEAVLPILDRFDGDRLGPTAGSFEGGDVVVDGRTVYVGLGQRTDPRAVDELREPLEARGFAVEPVPLRSDALHLDVVLNLVAPGIGLVYAPALPHGIPPRLTERYDFVEVSEDEQQRLGANVFAIEPGVVVTDTRNPRVNEELVRRGIETIELPFTETTKIGGSFRCMTLPLVRQGF